VRKKLSTRKRLQSKRSKTDLIPTPPTSEPSFVHQIGLLSESKTASASASGTFPAIERLIVTPAIDHAVKWFGGF
jgi:hypothetical protein